jgi:transposase-like protein
MMTKATQTNYTEAQTTQLVADYKAGVTVEAIATALGKTTRSVVAKLSREGVYQAKTKAKGQARVKKADLVDQLANKCGVNPEVFESLEKANLDVLEALVARLA